MLHDDARRIVLGTTPQDLRHPEEREDRIVMGTFSASSTPAPAFDGRLDETPRARPRGSRRVGAWRPAAIACLAAVLALAPTVAPVEAKPKRGDHPGRNAIIVRGGYLNDGGCVPVRATVPDEDGVARLECTGTSLWNGDLTGRTVIRLRGWVDTVTMEMYAEYEELFVGTYAGDDSVGGLRFHGRLWIDENASFHAEAEVVGGTCAWAGSSGTFVYDGHAANGGYVGDWLRPAVTPTFDPACNPAESRAWLE